MKVPNTGRVAQEMYEKNIELAETNKVLMLLRRIDEVVLGTVTELPEVALSIATSVAEDSGFPFAAIYLRNQRKGALVAQAVVSRIGTPEAQIKMERAVRQTPISLRHRSNPTVRAVSSLMIVMTEHLFEVMKPSIPIDDAEEIQNNMSLKTFLICPLQSRGEVIGAMLVGSPEAPSALSFYERNILERLTGAVGVALDNTLLYAEAEDVAKRLRTANRHLKELDVAKDEFISMASHQLRTPLTTIKGYVSMLLDGDVGPLSRQQREFLEYAYGGSQRMVNLISDLLNVSRMSAGKFQIQAEPTDLEAMVAEEVQQLQQHAQAKSIKLSFEPPEHHLPHLQLDGGKTRQVVMNFIDNAIYYTKQGEIRVVLKQRRNRVELRVIDTGIGVPKEAQRNLYKKFFRASNAQVMRPDGTGLGLFLAKRVIEDQDGTIIFESVEGKGSTFGFSVPLTKDSDGTNKRSRRK